MHNPPPPPPAANHSWSFCLILHWKVEAVNFQLPKKPTSPTYSHPTARSDPSSPLSPHLPRSQRVSYLNSWHAAIRLYALWNPFQPPSYRHPPSPGQSLQWSTLHSPAALFHPNLKKLKGCFCSRNPPSIHIKWGTIVWSPFSCSCQRPFRERNLMQITEFLSRRWFIESNSVICITEILSINLFLDPNQSGFKRGHRPLCWFESYIFRLSWQGKVSAPLLMGTLRIAWFFMSLLCRWHPGLPVFSPG